MKDVFHSNTIELKLAKEMYPYFKSSYDTKERFCSYWHQLDEVITLKPKEVLEIGIGNSFLTRYLKERDIKVTTLDIEHELRPDVAGSVLFLPFYYSSFDFNIFFISRYRTVKIFPPCIFFSIFRCPWPFLNIYNIIT